jgi:hypothetical protein
MLAWPFTMSISIIGIVPVKVVVSNISASGGFADLSWAADEGHLALFGQALFCKSAIDSFSHTHNT